MLSLLLLLWVFLLVVFVSSLLLLHVAITSLHSRGMIRTRSYSDPRQKNWEAYRVRRDYRVLHPKVDQVTSESEYPMFESLLDILERWNPCTPEPPTEFRESLLHFNYSDPEDIQMAETYRDRNLPFKLLGIPDFKIARDKWTIDYLSDRLGDPNRSRVEESDSQHFLFWAANLASERSDYHSPTRIRYMSFKDWFQRTQSKDSKYYYFIFQNFKNETSNDFMYEDLPAFANPHGNFFIPNPRLSARGEYSSLLPLSY